MPDTVWTSWPTMDLARRESTHSSRRTLRAGRTSLLRFLKERDHLFLGNRRKPLQEIRNGFASFEIINQRLHGHTSATKYGRSAHNFRLDSYDALLHDKLKNTGKLGQNQGG